MYKTNQKKSNYIDFQTHLQRNADGTYLVSLMAAKTRGATKARKSSSAETLSRDIAQGE